MKAGEIVAVLFPEESPAANKRMAVVITADEVLLGSDATAIVVPMGARPVWRSDVVLSNGEAAHCHLTTTVAKASTNAIDRKVKPSELEAIRSMVATIIDA